MKITSTPPLRYRPRKDYEGPVAPSASFAYGKLVYVSLRGNGDRQWTIVLEPEEWERVRDTIDRMIERRF